MKTDWKIGRIRSVYFILQAEANPIIEPNGKKANAMASFEDKVPLHVPSGPNISANKKYSTNTITRALNILAVHRIIPAILP